MTKAKEWTPYKAHQRRKKIVQVKRMKAARYVEEMNKRANDQSTTSSTG